MSYDEQAARKLVAGRVTWAVALATRELESANPRAVATLASEMLRQLPMVVPETPNDG